MRCLLSATPLVREELLRLGQKYKDRFTFWSSLCQPKMTWKSGRCSMENTVQNQLRSHIAETMGHYGKLRCTRWFTHSHLHKNYAPMSKTCMSLKHHVPFQPPNTMMCRPARAEEWPHLNTQKETCSRNTDPIVNGSFHSQHFFRVESRFTGMLLYYGSSFDVQHVWQILRITSLSMERNKRTYRGPPKNLLIVRTPSTEQKHATYRKCRMFMRAHCTYNY